MSPLEPDITEEARKKRTIWLLAGGAASLLLPLLGVFYLHWNSLSGGQGPSGRSDVFERRDSGDKRITPSQVAAPSGPGLMSPQAPLPTPGKDSGGSSLDFIKPGQEMAVRAPDAPKTATTTAPAAPAQAAPAPAAAATAKTTAKKGKKEFTMPKLQPSRGFTGFSGKSPTKTAPAAAQGGGGAQDILSNLPPDAANNPQLQQYLKQQQGK